MERLIRKDEKFKIPLLIVKILYVITGIVLGIIGIIHKNAYEISVGFSTILLLPLIYIFRRLFKVKGGYQMETYVYIFSFLGWSLGGAGQCFERITHYDKVVHFISGIFVSMIAIMIYSLLEKNHSKEGRNPVTEIFFVFFASMAVASVWEIIEYVLTPVMNRDLQHVGETGIHDTMIDMIMCFLSTIFVVVLMILKECKVMNNPISDAAEVLVYQNSKACSDNGEEKNAGNEEESRNASSLEDKTNEKESGEA